MAVAMGAAVLCVSAGLIQAFVPVGLPSASGAPALRGSASFQGQSQSQSSSATTAMAVVSTLGVAALAAGLVRRRPNAVIARQAETGFKMSKSVPFLPVSPALEGYVGEEEGFDPMGVSLAIDIRWLREAELKHARVAMLATLGWITTDLGVRVPGPMFQVSTLQAHDAMVDFSSMSQMLVWIGYAELYGFLAIINMMEGKTERKPGDFGLRALYPADEKGQYEMQLKELRNGRLAMLAYSGIVTSAVLTGGTWPFFAVPSEQTKTQATKGSALCGASAPLRRAATAGVSACRALETSKSLPFLPKPKNLDGLVGFKEQEFDPLAFGELVDPKWLREAELKHGRVTMVACLGFMAQQYITMPGMTPTPNALDAVYTPGGLQGLGLIIAAAGWIESSAYGGKLTMLDMFENSDRTPGDLNFGSGFLKGKSEDEIYDLKLKELNNGRLAMMAFGGMIHHNIVVQGPLFPIFPEGWAGPQGSWTEENTGFITELVRGTAGWNGTFENAPKGFYPQGPNQWTPESPPDMVVELNLGGAIGL